MGTQKIVPAQYHIVIRHDVVSITIEQISCPSPMHAAFHTFFLQNSHKWNFLISICSNLCGSKSAVLTILMGKKSLKWAQRGQPRTHLFAHPCQPPLIKDYVTVFLVGFGRSFNLTGCRIEYHGRARRHRARQTTRAWRREGGRQGASSWPGEAEEGRFFEILLI